MTTQKIIFCFILLFCSTTAFSIREYIRGGKRTNPELSPCPTWHPFQCPNGDCISIRYLCDGSFDCTDEFDENPQMCTAAARPPVEETASFLKALLHAHGDDFFVKLFGPKAKSQLSGLGGVDAVAVALSRKIFLDFNGS
uniref:Prohormone-4 n=1 Tax=Panagrolaimus sp. PS1159 TaxID=55785 RepID=A0AC35FLJ8_9BILA